MRMRWRLKFVRPAYRLCSSVAQECTTMTWCGEYFVDLLVEDVLLVELKTVRALDDAHRMQCTNYLKATGLQLCLLLNFGKPRLEIKRVVHYL
jgi:GxxExxY protein